MKTRPAGKNEVIFVSFSGMDGAGKSTQIEALHRYLTGVGLSIRVQAFWDNVAWLGKLREFSSHKLFKSERGIGSPEKPVERRDKNVKAWYLSLARFFLYTLDALSLSGVARKLRNGSAEVIIFDRYLYDELANLPLEGKFARAYVRLILRCIPRPDVAFLLDADPVQARARKPEYPVEFLQKTREAYLLVCRLASEITIVEPLPQSEVQKLVLEKLQERLKCGPRLNTPLAKNTADCFSESPRAIEP